jgi:hypothetical protein
MCLAPSEHWLGIKIKNEESATKTLRTVGNRRQPVPNPWFELSVFSASSVIYKRPDNGGATRPKVLRSRHIHEWNSLDMDAVNSRDSLILCTERIIISPP